MAPTLTRLSPNVQKIISDSNCYLVEGHILIDTSDAEFETDIRRLLSSIVPLDKIDTVIFTHLHVDHVGNWKLFPKAKFYASSDAVERMKDEKQKFAAVLDRTVAAGFNPTLLDITKNKELLSLFEITPAPGHTSTSITLYYKKDNVLFTGDNYYREGIYGRTDFPLSDPNAMEHTLEDIESFILKKKPIIAAGHDY